MKKFEFDEKTQFLKMAKSSNFRQTSGEFDE